MSYFINNLNQKIAYKSIKGGKLGIIYVHGLNSDMEGEKAIKIQKYAEKNKQLPSRKKLLTYSGFIWGKVTTSLIDCCSAASITSLSMPTPSPPVGGSPYCIATT